MFSSFVEKIKNCPDSLICQIEAGKKHREESLKWLSHNQESQEDNKEVNQESLANSKEVNQESLANSKEVNQESLVDSKEVNQESLGDSKESQETIPNSDEKIQATRHYRTEIANMRKQIKEVLVRNRSLRQKYAEIIHGKYDDENK
jgi:hypothetical protein